MHHQQAGNAGRPAMVQKTLHQMHRCGAFFARQAPLRRILPDLSPVFAIKGRFAAFFHFWHSPCFISIVLAAAITEY
ncbi:hypothetical protein LNQ03_09975 [Klebsiella pneumoniae subsp. pneumoniae]|nr:hypothetical protein [Klebsiella pneumoniae subsp. pneumoniae]